MKFNLKKFIKIRKDSSISQYDFAKKIGVSRQAINLIEHGVNVPKTETLCLIVRKIEGVKLEDFFS